jgi:hypothetical protein
VLLRGSAPPAPALPKSPSTERYQPTWSPWAAPDGHTYRECDHTQELQSAFPLLPVPRQSQPEMDPAFLSFMNSSAHQSSSPDKMFRKVSKFFVGGEAQQSGGDSEGVQQVLGQKCVDLLSASVIAVESIDDASGKYDAFVISIKDARKEYKIRKRYSEFEAFRALCIAEIPDVYFPGKKINFLQMNAEKLERRRGKLDKFLKAVLSCKTMTMVLQCDVLNFLEAFVNLNVEPGTPLFTYTAVAKSEFALTSSAQITVAVVAVAKDTKADVVLYDVEVIVADGTKYRLQHRFSAFQELHEKFNRVLSHLYFPGTHHIFVDSQKQESRRVKLDQWLRGVMSSDAMPTDLQRELIRFLDLFNKMGLHPQVRARLTIFFCFYHLTPQLAGVAVACFKQRPKSTDNR